jgi:predicted CXXCH cytochrome family protein
VILAVLLVSLVGQALGLPFSHQTHLKLNLTCTGCHSSATSSTKAADNNLPQPAVCVGCHKDVQSKPPAATNLARFSHKLHSGMGNIAPVIAAAIDRKSYLGDGSKIRAMLDTSNACGACHRGMEQSTEVSKAVFPAMADCLVCHNKIDPPFSCEQCHDEPKKLKPAYHTADFMDSHHRKSADIDRTTCAGCHGRKFTCLGCH